MDATISGLPLQRRHRRRRRRHFLSWSHNRRRSPPTHKYSRTKRRRCPIIESLPPQKSLPDWQFTSKKTLRPGGRRVRRIFAGKLSAGETFLGNLIKGGHFYGACDILIREIHMKSVIIIYPADFFVGDILMWHRQQQQQQQPFDVGSRRTLAQLSIRLQLVETVLFFSLSALWLCLFAWQSVTVERRLFKYSASWRLKNGQGDRNALQNTATCVNVHVRPLVSTPHHIGSCVDSCKLRHFRTFR